MRGGGGQKLDKDTGDEDDEEDGALMKRGKRSSVGVSGYFLDLHHVPYLGQETKGFVSAEIRGVSLEGL